MAIIVRSIMVRANPTTSGNFHETGAASAQTSQTPTVALRGGIHLTVAELPQPPFYPRVFLPLREAEQLLADHVVGPRPDFVLEPNGLARFALLPSNLVPAAPGELPLANPLVLAAQFCRVHGLAEQPFCAAPTAASMSSPIGPTSSRPAQRVGRSLRARLHALDGGPDDVLASPLAPP